MSEQAIIRHSDIDVYEQVKQIIDNCRAKKEPLLDLSRKGLSQIPIEIFDLTHLERLDLYNNFFDVVPADIGRLTNLKSCI